jgi:hypothetical protein
MRFYALAVVALLMTPYEKPGEPIYLARAISMWAWTAPSVPVDVQLDERGRVISVHAVGAKLASTAAELAARMSTYRPAQRGDTPVPSTLRVTVPVEAGYLPITPEPNVTVDGYAAVVRPIRARRYTVQLRVAEPLSNDASAKLQANADAVTDELVAGGVSRSIIALGPAGQLPSNLGGGTERTLYFAVPDQPATAVFALAQDARVDQIGDQGYVIDDMDGIRSALLATAADDAWRQARAIATAAPIGALRVERIGFDPSSLPLAGRDDVIMTPIDATHVLITADVRATFVPIQNEPGGGN